MGAIVPVVQVVATADCTALGDREHLEVTIAAQLGDDEAIVRRAAVRCAGAFIAVLAPSATLL